MSEIDVNQFDEASHQVAADNKEYKYVAFISYRHLKPDAEIAQKIHTMIETFKLPKEFKVNGKQPTFRVFRDREELTTKDLAESLDEALRSSQFLIVICSKRLPKSEWCNKEVQQFIEMNGVDRVIPVLIEGEPSESYPYALRGIDVDGNQIEDAKEILGAELRPTEVLDPDFIGYEVLEKENPQKLDELTKKSIDLLKTEKYRIMAAILGVTYGDLKQRDKERRQRQLLISSMVAIALLSFFGVFMFNAYQNENRAKIVTIQDRSRLMLDNAQELINRGDMIKAMIVANEAIGAVDPSMEQYQTLKNRHYSILNNSMDLESSSVISVIDTHNRFTFLDFNNEGNQFIAGLNNDSIGVWDTKTGSLIKSVSGHTQQVKLVEYSNSNDTFVSGGFDDLINIWDTKTYENLAQVKTPGNVMLLAYSSDDSKIHVIYDTMEEYRYQAYDTENLDPIGDSFKLNNNIQRVSINDDDQTMLVNYSTFRNDQSLYLYDLEKGIVIENFPDQVFEMENLDNEMEATKFPYSDMVMSKDKKYFYSKVKYMLMKFDAKTGEPIFRVEDESSIGDTLAMAITDDDKYVYYGAYANVIKVDAQTGEKLAKIQMSGEEITSMKLSSDNKKLFILAKDGAIKIIENDALVDPSFDYKSGRANYLYPSPDNQHMLALSLNDQNIKVISVNPNTASLVLNGQIAGMSKNGNYTLFYEQNNYYLFDNVKLEKVNDVKSDYLPTTSAYIFEGRSYVLSNDGSKIAGIRVEENDFNRDVYLFVLDSNTGDLLYETLIEMTSFHLGISDDGQFLYANEDSKTIKRYFIDSKETDTLSFEAGFVNQVHFTKDNLHYAVSYDEGITNIYKVEDQSLVKSIPGEIVYFEGDEIVSIYNNIGSHYVDFELESEVVLSKQRDVLGFGLKDSNFYNKENNLLLTIKGQEDDIRYAYLLDFNSGELLKTYEISINSYPVKGYIIPSGEGIILDQSFATTRSDFDLNENDLDNFGDIYKYSKTSALYTLTDYETIYKESLDYIKDVQLTEAQRIELGLGN